MTVKRLIQLLQDLPNQNAKVVMCMDWTAKDEDGIYPNEQWEDDLGDIATSGPTAEHVYLLNQHFK